MRLDLAAALLGAAVAAVVAGCGAPATGPPAPTAGVSPPPTTVSVSPDPSICPDNATGDDVRWPQGTVHLEAGTAVDAAFVCGLEHRRVPGDGEWMYLVVSQVTDGLDELLTVYAEPDAGRGTGRTTCTLEARSPLVVWLQADDVVAVRAPKDVCGKPTKAADRAYRALVLEPVREVRLRQSQSQLSIDSTCSDAWKAGEPRPDPTRFAEGRNARHPARVGVGVNACVFEVSAEEATAELPVGTLAGGSVLTDVEAERLRAALGEAPVDPKCGLVRPREFLVTSGGAFGIVLTPDGCVTQEDGAWRVSPDLYRALAQARTGH